MGPTFCNRCGDTVEEACDPKDELAELDALLERLRLKRDEVKRKINQFHSPIVRQLPPDVTSTIFEFCLPDKMDHLQYSPCTQDSKDFSIPLSLGAICSYWRDIAWSTPSLWSSLAVHVTNKHDSNSRIIAGIAQEWLARSGNLPLSIRIISTCYTSNITVPILANVINQYSTRWSDLDFFMPVYFYHFFHATDNHAPILKSIRFHCLGKSTSLNFHFQLTCPSLERAGLFYIPLGMNEGGGVRYNIQWDNLTHLTLHSMSIIDTFNLLRKTPRLVFCKVSGWPVVTRGMGVPVITTSLKSLIITTANGSDDLLNNLIAPHLEELKLLAYDFLSVEVITSFVRSSACSLRSFTAFFSVLPPYFEGFMNLLQSLPSLNTLSITSITVLKLTAREEYDPRNILQLVAKVLSSQRGTSLQQHRFLPNLKVLEYTGELYLPPENYDDLYPLPPADNAVHGPLHLLKLDLHPATRIPKNMISYLSSLVERGITVNVSSDSEDILQSSIDHYRFKKDFLCRDWTDNLDSSLLT